MISGLASYPGGILGTGLLLLRFSLAGALVLLSGADLEANTWLQYLSVIVGLGLCAGIRTRGVAALAFAELVFVLVAEATPSWMPIIQAIDAVALILTGPGAWSIDALLYGRRTVRLPDRQ